MNIEWWAAIVLVVDLVVRVVAVIVVPRNRKPESAMAWLLAIYFIPLLGVLLYLLISSPKLPRVRRKIQDEINAYLRARANEIDLHVPPVTSPPWLENVRTLNETLGSLPMLAISGARLIDDYAESLADMTQAVSEAQVYVHVEFYILTRDEATSAFFDELAAARARGVRVSVLFDHWATWRKPYYRETIAWLREHDIEYHRMLPLDIRHGKFQRPDLRNHRKLLVVDGQVGFLGSQNVIDESYNLKRNIRRGLKWVDLMVRLEGPIVSSVDAVFLSDWYSETRSLLPDVVELGQPGDSLSSELGQVVPSGPGFDGENNLRLFLSLFYYAQERVVLVSPYFVPNEPLMQAIYTALNRGISVELFVSEDGDQALVYHAQRSYYEALLRAGVRIWMYPKPFILHSKAMTVDDEVAVIGSSNMDQRSFGLNMEISLLVRGPDFVADMRAIEQRYRDISRELTLEEWLKQPLRSTVLDNLARLSSALQ